MGGEGWEENNIVSFKEQQKENGGLIFKVKRKEFGKSTSKKERQTMPLIKTI